MTEKDDSYKWLAQDSTEVDRYLDIADIVIVERKLVYRILINLLRYHFDTPQNLNMLDLGCGDGILTKQIRDSYPDNNFYLIDGAANMISKAKENLLGDNVSFSHKTFEYYIEEPFEENKYDFVYSANSIHHLDIDGKQRLYSKIYQEMKSGGLFINIDVVKSASKKSEEWQFRMWIDWINETLYKHGFKDDIGKYDDTPNIHKTQEENKPSTLFEQCDLLSKIGFEDVDCFYKYSIFTVFGGTKRK